MTLAWPGVVRSKPFRIIAPLAAVALLASACNPGSIATIRPASPTGNFNVGYSILPGSLTLTNHDNLQTTVTCIVAQGRCSGFAAGTVLGRHFIATQFIDTYFDSHAGIAGEVHFDGTGSYNYGSSLTKGILVSYALSVGYGAPGYTNFDLSICSGIEPAYLCGENNTGLIAYEQFTEPSQYVKVYSRSSTSTP